MDRMDQIRFFPCVRYVYVIDRIYFGCYLDSEDLDFIVRMNFTTTTDFIEMKEPDELYPSWNH